ncbi:hypothetical protein N7451_007938 [Penicillium sp. IBT 35674x]|nr:hypothetical protein N7451_007938 [Penicillium sp. IBT 35674x]
MDSEYYSDLSIIFVVLFSFGFSILYWRIWLRIWKCLKSCFQPERPWGIVKNCCRYVFQLPRRAYYAIYRRMGISVLFAEVFPDDTDRIFEEDQVIYDHDAEVLSRLHDCNGPPFELVPLPEVGHNSTSSVYSSHHDLQQPEVYSPVPYASSHESKEDVLSSDADKNLVTSRVDDWVAATTEYLTTRFDETAATTAAE